MSLKMTDTCKLYRLDLNRPGMLPVGQHDKHEEQGHRRNIWKVFPVVLLAVLWLRPAPLCAQQARRDDMAEFLSVFRELQALPAYQYETETDARYPNGQKDKLETRLCVNRKEKKLFYQTSSQVLVINNDWIYSADLFHQTVSILRKSKYPEYRKQLPGFNDLFNGGLIKGLIDSMVLKHAAVSKTDRNGDLLTFRLSFPKGFYVEQFIMVYNTRTALPEVIRFRARYAEGRRADGKEQATVYETVCRHYSKQVPDNVFDTRKYFHVEGGKVQLSRFKNYKASSVL